MEHVFFEITVVICLSSILAILFRLLKQPAILGYILAGVLIGPVMHMNFQSQEQLRGMAQLGVTLLLFMMGLELRFHQLRSIGGTALFIGIFQIVLTLFLGIDVCLALGFPLLSAVYLALAFTFSSTIIVVKILSDKKDLMSLHGKISVGVLLVQDFFAIFVLMFLSGFTPSLDTAITPVSILAVFAKGILLFVGIISLSKTVFPKLMHSIGKSQETLFLFSLAWVFSLSALVSSQYIHFPIEMGGFLAGLALANSSENFQIVARVKALRDFFITIFFVTLGMQMTFSSFDSIILPSLLLSIFVLVIKPIIVMGATSVLRYRKRTSFLTAINTAQISEFSLIIVFIGNKLGHIPESIVSIVTIVGIVTFTVSTYMMLYSNILYRKLMNYLGFFERKTIREGRSDSSETELSLLDDHVALIGAHRIGESILRALTKDKQAVIVLDFDPDVIENLKKKGIMCVFGDIADVDIYERIKLEKAKLVISTVPDVEDNLVLVKSLQKTNRKAKIVVIGQDADDEKQLYKAGADYVIVPHLISGEHLVKIIKEKAYYQ